MATEDPESNGVPRPVDEIDQKILEAVIQYPKIAVQSLVKYLADAKIKLSESAVQKRFSDLVHQRRLERLTVVRDWVASGYPFRYRIDIKADMRALRDGNGGPPNEGGNIDSQKKLCAYIKDTLGREYRFRGRLVVVEAMILLGQAEADISITVRVKDPKTILEFVTEGLRVLRGVESSIAAHEAWTYGEPE
jgi:DNA-binding Lrp family transcriptional regulator